MVIQYNPIFHKNISNLFSPNYTFCLSGNIVVYTPSRCTNRERYFNHINYKGKMPTVAGNKHVSIYSFPHRPRLFYLSTKKFGSNSSKKDIKVVFPPSTKNQTFSHNRKVIILKIIIRMIT